LDSNGPPPEPCQSSQSRSLSFANPQEACSSIVARTSVKWHLGSWNTNWRWSWEWYLTCSRDRIHGARLGLLALKPNFQWRWTSWMSIRRRIRRQSPAHAPWWPFVVISLETDTALYVGSRYPGL